MWRGLPEQASRCGLMRPSAHQRGGIFALSEDMEMKSKISTLARKVEELEGKRLHEVQAVTENPA